jgi:single-strand DNA-binding protein
MAKNLNKVILTGNLGKDVETIVTGNGNTIAKFSIAVSNTKKDGTDDVLWMNCTAWNALAEVCEKYLHKGSKVLVEGRLQSSSWDDAETGVKKYKTELIVENMLMLDSKGAGTAAEVTADEELMPF